MGVPKWKFSTRKEHFTSGKKSGKMALPPQKNMPVTPLKEMFLKSSTGGMWNSMELPNRGDKTRQDDVT